MALYSDLTKKALFQTVFCSLGYTYAFSLSQKLTFCEVGLALKGLKSFLNHALILEACKAK